MNINKHIVKALLRIYPAGWRNEYGPELEDTLLSHPVGAHVVGDVLWNGLRQRIRAAEPSTIIGLAMMLLVLIGLARNIASPPPDGWMTLLQDSSRTLPRVIVRPVYSELYVLLMIVSGCWTCVRHAGNASQSGRAAVRVSFLAGIPIIVTGVLMLFGMLDIVAVAPGDTVTAFHEHGFTYTYYNAQHQPPGALSVMLAPLFALPYSWIWGTLGGRLGRWLAPLIRRPLTSS